MLIPEERIVESLPYKHLHAQAIYFKSEAESAKLTVDKLLRDLEENRANMRSIRERIEVCRMSGDVVLRLTRAVHTFAVTHSFLRRRKSSGERQLKPSGGRLRMT